MENKFSDRYIKSIEPKKYIYDIREPNGHGFAIRIFPSGKKSWTFLYTYLSRKRRMTLGKYPTISLANARIKHREALIILEKDKKDPGLEKQKAILESRNSSTIKALIEEYLEKYAKVYKRTWKEDQRILYKDILRPWGNRKVHDITRRDIIRLLDKIKERGSPITANRTLACIRKMFNFAVERAILNLSPCQIIATPSKENSRERYLNAKEIKIFWDGLKIVSMSEALKLALKFLLTTAQRKTEVISAEWNEIDFAANIWTIPAQKAKNNLAHRVPLSNLALDLLHEIKKLSGDSIWLFPSEKTNTSIRGQSLNRALYRNLHMFSNVEGFCVHDCRRTAATHMASLLIPIDTISRILNHTRNNVTEQYYIKHSYDNEKRNALEV